MGRSKFNARCVEIDGERFDSRAEGRRYLTLRALEADGKIADLNRQVRFQLDVNGMRICAYVADFTYARDGVVVVEDVKGVKTEAYRLKKKLMAAIMGIEIHEIPA